MTIDTLQPPDSTDEELLEHLLLYSRSGARSFIEAPPAPLEVLIPLSAGQMPSSAAEEEEPSLSLDDIP